MPAASAVTMKLNGLRMLSSGVGGHHWASAKGGQVDRLRGNLNLLKDELPMAAVLLIRPADLGSVGAYNHLCAGVYAAQCRRRCRQSAGRAPRTRWCKG